MRLYAFAAGEALLSADVYGDFGHYELLQSEGRQYWAAARPETLAADEISVPAALPFSNPVAATSDPGPDGNYEVRVLVLYTALYAERIGRDVETEAQRLVFLANGYNETSGVPVRYALAGIAPFAGTHEDQNYRSNLQSMVGDAQIKSLRDSAGADLVMLVRSQDGTADLCGLSSGFNNLERSDPPQSVDPERDAFNVAGMAPGASGSACADNVFAHELAHSLAAGHDYATSAGFAYWKPYSHGSICPSADGNFDFFSLMWGQGAGPGFNPGVVRRSPGGRSDRITNPRLMLNGAPCGTDGVPGVEASQADNARAMSEAAPYVAAYRVAKQAGSVPRSLLQGESFIGSCMPWTLMLFGLAALAKRRPRARADC